MIRLLPTKLLQPAFHGQSAGTLEHRKKFFRRGDRIGYGTSFHRHDGKKMNHEFWLQDIT